VPVPSQQLAHRAAAPDLGEFRPVVGRFPGIGGAEIPVALGDVHPGLPFDRFLNVFRSGLQIDDIVNDLSYASTFFVLSKGFIGES
jgi:hypothetical protein